MKGKFKNKKNKKGGDKDEMPKVRSENMTLKCVKIKENVQISVAETEEAGGSLTFCSPLFFLQTTSFHLALWCIFRDSPPCFYLLFLLVLFLLFEQFFNLFLCHLCVLGDGAMLVHARQQHQGAHCGRKKKRHFRSSTKFKMKLTTECCLLLHIYMFPIQGREGLFKLTNTVTVNVRYTPQSCS